MAGALQILQTGILDDVELLCGQEVGSKEEILHLTAEGKYPGDHILMMGDAPGDMEAAHAYHSEMGCICFENPKMGIYFIIDPDGYWTEIIPKK